MEKIVIKTEYITLGQFLKFAGLIDNGSEAKFFLNEETVTVNNEIDNRRGRKLYPGYVIRIKNINYLVDNKWCFI